MSDTNLASNLPPLPSADLAQPDGRDAVHTLDGPALIASQCPACGRRCFPRRAFCFLCGGAGMIEVELNQQGTLYSFSAVQVSSSRPTPYTIGYVDLPDDVRVMSDLRGVTENTALDSPVILQIGEDGEWYFAPPQEHTA